MSVSYIILGFVRLGELELEICTRQRWVRLEGFLVWIVIRIFGA